MRKKQILVVVLAVVFVAIASYAVISIVTWNTYRDRVAQSNEQATTMPRKFIEGFDTFELRTVQSSREQLQQMKLAQSCDVPVLLGWQESLHSANKEARAQCKEAEKRLAQFREQAEKVLDFSEQWITLRTMYTNDKKEVKSDSIAQEVAYWEQSLKSFDTVQSEDLQKLYKDNASQILKNWKALQVANDKKDFEAFRSARTTLGELYSRANGIHAEAYKLYEKQVATLELPA